MSDVSVNGMGPTGVFLGTFTPRLDDKGRLILPAKFRPRLATGLVCTRGLDRCVFMFPVDEFHAVHDRLRQAPAREQAGARLPQELPRPRERRPARQAGPHPPLGATPGVRGHRPRRRGRRTGLAGGDLGRARLGRVPRCAPRTTMPRPPGRSLGTSRRATTPSCRAASLPRELWGTSPLQSRRRETGRHDGAVTELGAGEEGYVNDAAERHIPVMLDRCVELLRPALDRPGAVAIDATLGLGGHAEALLAACPGATLVGIDRDGDALRLASERLAALRLAIRRASRGVRRRLRVRSRRSARAGPTRFSSTSGFPRCRSTSPSGASATRPTRPSTCA